MTVTVIVFFHAVITVEDKSVFPKAEKYPSIIFHIPTTRQLTSEKILKQHRNTTAIIYRTTFTLPPVSREREIEKQKKEPKKSKRQRKREYMSVINQSYQSILIHLTIDVPPQGGQRP